MNAETDRITSLTLDRARAIVERAENEYATGRHIEYSFTPFKAGGASSPLEALQALYIVVAHLFWFSCVRKSGAPEAMKIFDDYAAASRFVAMSLSIESTEIHSIAEFFAPEMIATLRAFETVDSFASFLRTLRPESADYWPKVYQRLDLNYPTEPEPTPKPNIAQVQEKAWWRFW